ncbi:hypothetical protein Q7C_1075 [Methylophaga frappieri]|uniref:Lipoprotein n=1 Tax=Methylophaga frappieri (strain ATCC BAA-2434 / DSM 25690 / JAM7) TaxID=754477 RepID=I1YH39_METFJ|nr:hypothetical protein [Methylophaga frappieri]AFJ02232.1 hypothetical protein Q7C_1075 [Methylophaga frappieri]
MSLFRSRFLVAASLLMVGVFSVHAWAAQRADDVARGMVEALVTKLNQSGIQVEVGEVKTSPSARSVEVDNIRIRDKAGRAHAIEAITLKNIELNKERDFVESFQVDIDDAVVTLIRLTDQQNRLNVLNYYLQALGINSGRIGHQQTLTVNYLAARSQLQLEMEGQFHHPADSRSRSMADFRWKGHFSNVPDLRQQLILLGKPENHAALALAWTQLNLIHSELTLQDQGAWEPLVRSAAARENMTEPDFRTQLKQQAQQSVDTWRYLPADLKQTVADKLAVSIDSPQPYLQVDVASTHPGGNSIMMTMMTSVITPQVVTQLFNIKMEAQ